SGPSWPAAREGTRSSTHRTARARGNGRGSSYTPARTDAMAASAGEGRTGPSATAGEREMLRAFLDYHRVTLAMKCDGLSEDELRRQSSPPSALSLLGLVRHMAEVERTWFRRVINGENVGLVWSAEG